MEEHYKKLNLIELKKLCKDKEIKGYSSKNKDSIIGLLLEKSYDSKLVLNNISPLRYPGGKTRACKILDETILSYFDIKKFDTLVSPFFGGGSFEFYFQNKYGLKLLVNDKFVPLYSFWKQVKNDKKELCKELRKIKLVTKEQFKNYRNTIMELNLEDSNTLKQALQYFIINRCSFSGSTLSGGFSEEASSKRYTPSSIDKIESLDFTNIELYNYDFKEFIENFSNIKSLLFLDPPYYLEKKSKLYGHNGDMHESFNHQTLYDLLKTKNNWILTYNNCDYIKAMYKDYTILETSWSYGMNSSKSSSEIIIISK
jgi:DNA adenine methylase